jgi:hypothetical protein
MRNKRSLIGGVVFVGLLAAATSAMTATSTIARPSIFVGSAAQSIAGINVTNVQYTYAPSTDITTVVTFTLSDVLNPVPQVINVIATGDTSGTYACDAPTVTTDTVIDCTLDPGNGIANLTSVRLDIHD